jgi:hypothetical protein
MPVVKSVAVDVFVVCETVVMAGAENGFWPNLHSKSKPSVLPGADTCTVISPWLSLQSLGRIMFVGLKDIVGELSLIVTVNGAVAQ